MTAKDFRLVADTIAGLSESPEVRLRVAKAFALALLGTNPRFDAVRFIEAAR